MRLPSRTAAASALGILLALAAVPGRAQDRQATPAPAGNGRKSFVEPPAPAVVRAEERPTAATTDTAPQPVGFESDVYCFGYVGRLTEAFPARVTGAENFAEQTDFATDDLLYVDAGKARGLKIGDDFWLVTPEQEVLHPLTGKSLGRLYQYRGRAVVTNLGARTGTVRVSQACTDIPLGAYLKRFEPVPIPLARKSPPAVAGDPSSGKARGYIVFTRDGVVALGQDTMVIVDVGAADGISPGDFLTVFRYSQEREYGIRPLGTYWVNLPPQRGVVLPRTYLGEGAVLLAGDHWSVLRLTDSFRLIEVGDEVELK